MKVKGAGLKDTLVALEKIHGQDAVQRVKAAMPARLRDMLQKLKPLEWYPVELPAAVHVAIRDTLGGGGWQESHRIARRAAMIELTGVYRVMMRLVQYDTVWDRMERVWPQFYDAGEAHWVDRGRGHARAEFRGVAGFNDGMWASISGRIEILLEKTGSRAASVSWQETASTRATLEALWLE